MTPAVRRGLDSGLAALTLLVAVLTLTPAGPGGWAWGDPGTELRWYLTGLGDPATAGQLVGNLALLAPVAVLAVARWPGLRSAGRLAAASLTVAVGIETLQWLLPLGRVVSPVDAILNVLGAVVAGGAAALVLGHGGAGSPTSQRVGAGA
ncbi:VanZ family protein [Modestobacter sp. URMC 112]